MERRTALQAAGVFVVTVLAGLPFALQVGEWLGGAPDTPQRAPVPASSGLDPAEPDEGRGAAQPGGDPAPDRGPAAQPGPDGSRAPQPAKVVPAPGGPVEAAPVEPGQPGEPTGGPQEPQEPPQEPEPTGEPEQPEPTAPPATDVPDPQATVPAIAG